MTTKANEIDAFDRAYCDRIREAVWEAIIEASRDPATDLAPLRNYEIYDALLQLQAMILASSKEACSPTKMRAISTEFAKNSVGWSLSSRNHTIVTVSRSLWFALKKCNNMRVLACRWARQ